MTSTDMSELIEGRGFEADSLAALNEYQLTGEHLTVAAIDAVFTEALAHAKAVANGLRA